VKNYGRRVEGCADAELPTMGSGTSARREAVEMLRLCLMSRENFVDRAVMRQKGNGRESIAVDSCVLTRKVAGKSTRAGYSGRQVPFQLYGYKQPIAEEVASMLSFAAGSFSGGLGE
jgi:hypothetical protein